jgi:hypothetical protein
VPAERFPPAERKENPGEISPPRRGILYIGSSADLFRLLRAVLVAVIFILILRVARMLVLVFRLFVLIPIVISIGVAIMRLYAGALIVPS